MEIIGRGEKSIGCRCESVNANTEATQGREASQRKEGHIEKIVLKVFSKYR